MKIEFLSASGANVYEQCALRYYAKYILGKKSGVPELAVLHLNFRPQYELGVKLLRGFCLIENV